MRMGERPPTTDYQVLVEFEEWLSEEDLVTDLDQNPLHRLHHHRPSVTHGQDGHTQLSLTVAGPDVWTSTLRAMVLVRQAGYEPRAVHVAVAAVQRRDAA
jgi:hypothetical protein